MASQAVVRKRRESCWWEPTYDPSLVGALKTVSWDFSHTNGPVLCMLEGEHLTSYLAGGGSRVFKGLTFKDCDFQGFFKHSAQLVFDSCGFENCDFSLSTWTNTKFSKCSFRRVSFGQTKFDNCEFRNCNWFQIGLSPNGTELNSTYFSRCSDFIHSAYTNNDPKVLSANDKSAEEQNTKLEHTKATVARRILKMLQSEGDEEAFYDAVATFQVQSAISMSSSAKYDLFYTKNFFRRLGSLLSWIRWSFESFTLRIIGSANNWGASVTKPIFILIMAMLTFSAAYSLLCNPTKSANALQRSFDITVLAGYTNYGSESEILTIVLQDIHLFVSIVLYSVVFATLLNRISRVR